MLAVLGPDLICCIADSLVRRHYNEVSKGGYAWITQGKEVENYIPSNLFATLCGKEGLKGPGQFTDALAYIAEKKENRTKPVKVDLARQVCDLLDRESLAGCLDLGAELDKVCDLIYRWNRLERPGSQ